MSGAEKIYEERINRFLDDVDRREKSIEKLIEYMWKEINQRDCDIAILEWDTREIHDYKLMLNELSLVRNELLSILADVEAEREATTPDGWHIG